VYDAVIVGVPDERWGERVAAVVQLRPGASLVVEELAAHCRERIAGYKVPREMHVVDRVLRHPSGKPDYPWAKQAAVESREPGGLGGEARRDDERAGVARRADPPIGGT
jgi:acyl-CoA synthetase (AMP-forming)/AMP-acid ligase II